MKWSTEADNALRKVPFFVRKKVRTRVEQEAAEAGKKAVTLADVHASRKRFLNHMASEVKGYQLDTCFGAGGCPNRAVPGETLLKRLEAVLGGADLLSFLKSRVSGELKFHHEFRVTLAECPNACSQPQIKDIGILGAVKPMQTQEACTACGACVGACPDRAVSLKPEQDTPVIDEEKCQLCGLCITACPTGTLAEACRGFRILLGGKLGRHPRLARELGGIYNEDQVVAILEACLTLYKELSLTGQRFARILSDTDFQSLAARFAAAKECYP